MSWLQDEVTFENKVSFDGDTFVPYWELIVKLFGYPEGIDTTQRKINAIKTFRGVWKCMFFVTEESLRGSIKVLKIAQNGKKASFYLSQDRLNVQTFTKGEFFVHESWARAVMYAKRRGFTKIEVITCDHELPEGALAHCLVGRSWKASIGKK